MSLHEGATNSDETFAFAGQASAKPSTEVGANESATLPNDQSGYSSEESSVDIPVIDFNIPSIEGSLLEVVISQFRADDGKGRILGIGRGLVCHSHIIPQQEISTFVGKVISHQTASRMSRDRRSYVIEMSVPGAALVSNPTMLDCYDTSEGHRPTSLASMANCPLRLYNRVSDDSCCDISLLS